MIVNVEQVVGKIYAIPRPSHEVPPYTSLGCPRVGRPSNYQKISPTSTCRANHQEWLPLHDAFRNRDISLEIDLSCIKLLMEEANLVLV